MTKNLLNKIASFEDLKETGFNMAALWLAGKTANVIANSLFHFNLNKYNSVDHLVIGVGIGTLTYRKAGKGVKGVIAGLIAATMFNASWEYFENKYVFHDINGLTSIDTITDIASVYAGSVLGVVGEKIKDYHMNRNKIKKEERWLL
jgi:hypothetical protein